MSTIRETSSLPLGGPGCIMRFKVDDSKPEDSIDHHWSETTYDGEPDTWCPDIGAHWHKHHDEYMQVLEGRVDFVLDGKPITLLPGQEPLHIPRLHVHSFKFVKGLRTRFIERTDPGGDFKEKFFRELLGSKSGAPNFWTVMRSFYDGDCYIAFPGGFRGVDENVTWVLGKVAKWWEPTITAAGEEKASL